MSHGSFIQSRTFRRFGRKTCFYYVHNIRVTLSDKQVLGEKFQNMALWSHWRLLHVNNPRQLLNSVEQQVTLFDGFLILPVFAVRSVGGKKIPDLTKKKKKDFVTAYAAIVNKSPVGFHNLVNFIDFTVETARRYESGQFPVRKKQNKTELKLLIYTDWLLKMLSEPCD